MEEEVPGLDDCNEGALDEDSVVDNDDCALEDDCDDRLDEGIVGCDGRLDCADKQSAGQAFGFAFSNSSQILSPHWAISF
mgnify:CR=1 FL=1